MSKNKHLAFCYGSLKRGFNNYDRILKDNSTFLGEFVTEPVYNMHSLRAFPAVTLNGKTAIHGEVFEVDDVVLERLNRLEGFVARDHASNYYNSIDVETSFGKAVMYIMDGELNAPLVESGNWNKQYE